MCVYLCVFYTFPYTLTQQAHINMYTRIYIYVFYIFASMCLLDAVQPRPAWTMSCANCSAQQFFGSHPATLNRSGDVSQSFAKSLVGSFCEERSRPPGRGPERLRKDLPHREGLCKESRCKGWETQIETERAIEGERQKERERREIIIHVYIYIYMYINTHSIERKETGERERERERARERQRERKRQIEKREGQRERERGLEMQTERDSKTERERESETEREKEKAKNKQTCIQPRKLAAPYDPGRWVSWAHCARGFRKYYSATLLVVFWACMEESEGLHESTSSQSSCSHAITQK